MSEKATAEDILILMKVIFFVVLLFIMFSVLPCFVSCEEGRRRGYRAGQIDVLSNRRIVYELVEFEDGAKEWRKVEHNGPLGDKAASDP